MTFIQKIRMTKTILGNLWWSLKSEKFACSLMSDTSVGFYLRTNEPDLYKQYFLDYSVDKEYNNEKMAAMVDSIVSNTHTEKK